MSWKAYNIVDQVRIPELFSIFKVYYKHNFEFRGENHDFWECLYVISGTVRVSADERVYELKYGDIIFHKPLEFHKFDITSENGADIFVFSFSLEGELASFFENKTFRLSAEQNDFVASLIEYLDEKAQKHLNDKNIYTAYLKVFEESPVYMQRVVLNICQLLLSLTETSNVENVSNSPNAIVFREAIDYMNKNIYDKISVDMIASQCNISVSGLKRVFTKYSGIGVHKYFLIMKLKKAKKMLAQGSRVGDVAAALGFSSQAYFSKTYKREIGISPSNVKR